MDTTITTTITLGPYRLHLQLDSSATLEDTSAKLAGILEAARATLGGTTVTQAAPQVTSPVHPPRATEPTPTPGPARQSWDGIFKGVHPPRTTEPTPTAAPAVEQVQEVDHPPTPTEPAPGSGSPSEWEEGMVVPWEGVLSKVTTVRRSARQGKGWALLESGLKILYSTESGEVIDYKYEAPPGGKTLRHVIEEGAAQGISREDMASWCATKRAQYPVIASIPSDKLEARVARTIGAMGL